MRSIVTHLPLLLALALLPARAGAQVAFQQRGESGVHLGPMVLDRVGGDDDSEVRFVGGAAQGGVVQLEGRLLTRTIDGETSVGMEVEGLVVPLRPWSDRRLQPFLLAGYARDKRTVLPPGGMRSSVADDEIDVDIGEIGAGLLFRLALGRDWILAPRLWVRHSIVRGDDFEGTETVGRLELPATVRVHPEISLTGAVGVETGTGAAQLWLFLGVRFATERAAF